MAFSYYQTSVAISDSKANIIASVSDSIEGDNGYSRGSTYTECATRKYANAYTYDPANTYYLYATNDSSTNLLPKSITFIESQNDDAGFIFSYRFEYSNEAVSTSDFPYTTFKGTFFSSFRDVDAGSLVQSETHSETYTGIQGASNYELIYQTFTFTSTYSIEPTTTSEGSTYISFDTDIESTTYEVLEKNYTSSQSMSGSFTSTRAYDFIFYTAPQNISRSFDLKYFRPVSENSEWIYQNNLLRLFFSTGDNYLIGDYDTLLNETISTSFSTAGSEITLGSSVGTQPATSITLTTNGVSQYSASSSLHSITPYIFNYKGKTFGHIGAGRVGSFQYNYNNYSTTSATISYQVSANWATFAGAVSAYSQNYTRTVSTTSSYFDISCNLVTYILYTKTRTIATTSSGLLVTNTYLKNNSSQTDYAYPSYSEVLLDTAVRTPYDFRSFSSQKILHGNFIKDIDDETAYWSLDTASFGGIFDFSCVANRQDIFFPSYSPIFFRFANCYVVVPFDPISTSLNYVSINQSVSSNTSGTSISQLVRHSTTSTTRTFVVNYQESTGTMPWTWDQVVDFDNNATLGYLGADQQESRLIRPTPIVNINPNDIFNTCGQMGQAGYVADGGYFKENSSSITFVTTTYSQPISVESTIGNDNSFSVFTIFSAFGQSGNYAVSMSKGLQQFQTYY